MLALLLFSCAPADTSTERDAPVPYVYPSEEEASPSVTLDQIG